jgi:hypothetical protein
MLHTLNQAKSGITSYNNCCADNIIYCVYIICMTTALYDLQYASVAHVMASLGTLNYKIEIIIYDKENISFQSKRRGQSM